MKSRVSTGRPALRGANPSVRRLRELATEYYEETFKQFPEQGSASGRHEFDAALGHVNPGAWQRHERRVARTLAEVENLPRGDFGGEGFLERRAFLAQLRGQHLQWTRLRRHENDPQIHLHEAADSIYTLIVRHADDLTPVAAAVLSRLKQIPRYYEEAAECVRYPDPLWQELTSKASAGVGALFNSLPEPLAKATGKPIAALQRLADAAAQAAERYARHVAGLTPAKTGSFALGEDLFAARMHEQLGLDWSPAEALAVGHAQVARLRGELAREARKLGSRKGADALIAQARAEWVPAGGDLIGAYRQGTAEMRERFREAGWLTLPKSEKLIIRQVPAFMADLIPTAAYSAPGALDPDQTGIFWVNDLRSRVGPVARRRAETAQHFGLELTCAHEAYPGHHVQFVLQNRLPSLPRKLASHAIFYEGWTLWCEEMVSDLCGGGNPFLKLLRLHDELWRACRIIIDVGLQTGRLDYAGAVKLLMREVGFTRGRAEAEINWYSSSPTIPMSYLIGKLELKRLKTRMVDEGGLPLRAFNDWVLSFGAVPWRWIEESGIKPRG